MTDTQNDKPGTVFWVLSGFFLVFNLVGFMIYYSVVTTPPEVLAANLSPEKQAFLNAEPIWATAAYATAVTAGVVASILLMLRRAWAFPVYVISFIAVHGKDGLVGANQDTFATTDALFRIDLGFFIHHGDRCLGTVRQALLAGDALLPFNFGTHRGVLGEFAFSGGAAHTDVFDRAAKA